MEKRSVEELFDYLAEKGIDERTREVLREEEIDGSAFVALTEDDIKEMKIKIGPKRHLLSLITEEKSEKSDSASPPTADVEDGNRAAQTTPPPIFTSLSSHSVPSTSASSSTVEPNASFSDKSIREILLAHPQGGQAMVSRLEKGKGDEVKMRQILVGELVRHCGSAYPPDAAKLSLAKAIVREFPTLRDTFDPTLLGHERFFDSRTRKGSIEFRLYQIRKGLPQDQKRYKPKKIKVPVVEKSTQSLPGNVPPLLSEEKHDEEVSSMLLKTPTQANKLAISVSLAATLGNRRLKILQGSATISDILEEYPRLRDYQGDMIRREFDMLNEYNDPWGHFARYYVPRIFALAKERNPVSLDVLQEITSDDHFTALALLPELLPHANFLKSRKRSIKAQNGAGTTQDAVRTQKGAKKATVSNAVPPVFEDDEQSEEDTEEPSKSMGTKLPQAKSSTVPRRELIQILEPDADVTSTVKDNSKQLKQPYLIMVKGPTNPTFYLIAESLLVNLGQVTVAEAFDLLFKSHFVFNVHYATPLKFFYNFIETYIFKMTDSKPLPSVSTLHVELSNVDA